MLLGPPDGKSDCRNSDHQHYASSNRLPSATINYMRSQSPTIPTTESVLARVELAAEIGRWPAGTSGTLVETFPSGGFVEIVDDDGRTLDIVTAPHAELRLREPNSCSRRVCVGSWPSQPRRMSS
jgi:hypothetical protein